MRIAFILNSFPVISETFILRQAVGLIQHGHDVEIYAGRPTESSNVIHRDVELFNLLDRTRYRSTPPTNLLPRLHSGLSRMLRWGWRRPAAALESVNVFRHGRSALDLSLLFEVFPNDNSQREYDVIHGHFGPNGQRAVALRKAGTLKGPIVTTFYGYDANFLPRIHGPHLYKNLFKKGELFTVGSEFLRHRLTSLGAPNNQIFKLRMGVDISRYEFVPRQIIHNEPFKLLTVARLVEVKGIEYVIRAVALIKDKCPNLRYQIVGDGPLRAKLVQLTRELSITEMVEFLGAMSQEEVLMAYSKAHTFVLPSIVTDTGEEEGQPIVLAEAQASGLPVIATTIGGIPESIRNRESGLLVPQRDPEALASAILWLANHPDTWMQMGKAGRSYIEQYFNLEKLHDDLVDIYSIAIEKKK